MNNSNFIRLSGWAFIVGSVVFAPLILATSLENLSFKLPITLMDFMETIVTFGFFLGPVLLAVGMLGLWMRYGNKINVLGKGILLLGAFSGILVFISVIGQANGNDSLWGSFIIGTTLIFICLTIFGVLAIFQKPLSHRNWLPLFAGIWFPLMSLPGIFGIHFPMLGQQISQIFSLFSIIGILITTIALIMLGFSLQANPSQGV